MPDRSSAPSEGPRRVTLRTVADHAGVSKSVVSRVLQNSPKVAAASREAVQKAIEELGYRPNAVARSLTQSRTGTVGVLVSDLRQPWLVDFLDGLHATLDRHGLQALLADGRLDADTGDRLLTTFMEMRFDGLVLAASTPASRTVEEAARWFPTVIAGSRDFDLPCTDVVAEDDRLGAQLALDHLHGLGHTNILHVTAPDAKVFTLRAEGYRDWMTARGLSDAIRVLATDSGEAGGYRVGQDVFALPREQRPTAIFCASDAISVGILGAAHDLGVDIPGDISLASFDNSRVAAMGPIRLTSVDVSPRTVGELTADRLVERIADPARPAREHLVTPRLVVRSSTGRPRT